MNNMMGELGGLKTKVERMEAGLKNDVEEVREEVAGLKQEVWLEEQERKTWAEEWEVSWKEKESHWDLVIEDLKKTVEDFRHAGRHAPGGKGGVPSSNGGMWQGKGGGKSEEREEKRKQTATFKNFAKDSKADVVKHFIWEQVDAVKGDIEEVCTFDKRCEMGLARFKTKDAMWKFVMKIQDSKVDEKPKFQGRMIYIDSDRPLEGGLKEKSVRKVVRVIIEQGYSGDAGKAKAEMEAIYRKGVVWWKDDKLAEWNEADGEMKIMGDLQKWEQELSA